MKQKKYEAKTLPETSGRVSPTYRTSGKKKGLRVVIILEGRDGAGKGGTIKAITERVSPQVSRVVALPAPSDREKSQLYLQRYFQHLPAAGEVVIFDRSWYNRASIEHVMGFCTQKHIRTLSRAVSGRGEIHGRGRRSADQTVGGSQQRRSSRRRFEARIQGSPEAVEVEPDGPPVTRASGTSYSKARDHKVRSRPTDDMPPWYPAPIGRQENSAPERHRPHSRPDSAQEAPSAKK